ncbi:MAG TPA: hypothetical protein ENH85_14105 [Candidatus Scalindua sp.]|nr:hypothetical protein [Candidatus Scalindua sp.]
MKSNYKMYRVRKNHEDDLLKLENVIGVGIGDKIVAGVSTKRKCIRIYVEKKVSIASMFSKDIVPRTLDLIETDVIEIGKIIALSFKHRLRPAKGGISIGHYKITAGTLGCLVRDRESKEILILSNNHVLAQSNKAKIGDVIIQPGKHDKGILGADEIATLERFVKIKAKSWWRWWANPKNIVDCAIAKPFLSEDVSPEILEIGIPTGIELVDEDMELQKSGRTTGHTKGKVIDADVTVAVSYGNFTARFKHQIMASAMSAGGDSGSLVLNEKKAAVGLLFAGSEKVTILNPINDVLTLLDVELITDKNKE